MDVDWDGSNINTTSGGDAGINGDGERGSVRAVAPQ